MRVNHRSGASALVASLLLFTAGPSFADEDGGSEAAAAEESASEDGTRETPDREDPESGGGASEAATGSAPDEAAPGAAPRRLSSTRTSTRAKARSFGRRMVYDLEILPGAMARPTGIPKNRGLWFGSPDRRFMLRALGLAHLDGRFTLAPTGDVDVLPRRLRIAIEAVMFGELDFRGAFDVAVRPLPIDFYLDWRRFPEFSVRVGIFKSPFGFERRARAFALTFIERGFPNELSPNRDVGVFFHGQSKEGFFSYDVALLSGAADLESIDEMARDDPEIAGRIYFQPFRLLDVPALYHFGLGLSGSYGEERGNPEDARLGRVSTLGRQRIFEYQGGEDGAYANGTRARFSAHGFWRKDRWKALFEYVWSMQRVQRGQAAAPVAHQAWQAWVSYAVTDDENGFFGISPKRPLDPSRGQWGGVSVAARVQGIHLDPTAFREGFADAARFAKMAQGTSLSAQWHMTDLLELEAELQLTVFDGPTAGPLTDPELTFALRLEANF